jgi:hypothetical protein
VPITAPARFKAWTVFARSNTAIVGSNSTWGIDDCVRLFCAQVVALRRTDPCPRGPTDCVRDQENEKAAKVPQKDWYIDR